MYIFLAFILSRKKKSTHINYKSTVQIPDFIRSSRLLHHSLIFVDAIISGHDPLRTNLGDADHLLARVKYSGRDKNCAGEIGTLRRARRAQKATSFQLHSIC